MISYTFFAEEIVSWKNSHICEGKGDINLFNGTKGQRKS